MSSSFLNASVVSSAASSNSCSGLHRLRQGSFQKLAFSVSSRPKLKLFVSKGVQYSKRWPFVPRAELSKASVDGPISATTQLKAESPSLEIKDGKPTSVESSGMVDSSVPAGESDESISDFINQVSSLVKLVDSKDIVELQMKHSDCEILIRKKEAIPQPVATAPPVMLPSAPAAVQPSLPATAALLPPPSLPSAATSAPPVKSSNSSLPRIKSPMAGTFYKAPQPGAPPFVKVGDKITKGQALCIIEAMKLMNEIEAEEDGTIVEVLLEDATPVSLDTELFVIQQ